MGLTDFPNQVVTKHDYVSVFRYSPSKDIVGYQDNAAYNQGVVSKTGKTAEGSTQLWSNTLTNGQRWMFGALLAPS